MNRRTPLMGQLVIIFVLTVAPLAAQRILYDAARDKSAQDAQSAANQISSGALFDKILSNVAAEAKVFTQVQVDQESEASRATLNALQRWRWNNSADYATLPKPQLEVPGIPLVPDAKGDVCLVYLSKRAGAVCRSLRCQLEELEQRLNLDTASDKAAVAEQLKDIQGKKKTLTEALNALKGQTNDPDIKALVDKTLGQVQDVVTFAESLGKQVSPGSPVVAAFDTSSKALGSIQSSLDQILQLYGIVQGIWAGAKAISVDPSGLGPPREKTDLALLAVDEEHFRRLGLIRARTHLLVSDTNQRLQSAKALLQELHLWDSEEKIEDTLGRTNDRDALERTLRALHLASAALAAGQAIVDLSCNQESFERRTAALQRYAIESHVYELTLQAAAQRLTLYWKAGIKPDQLAQLIFNLTSAVSLPIIANK